MEKLFRPHGEGSPQLTWTRTIGLGVVEHGLAETAQQMEAGRGQTDIWTIDPYYPHFQLGMSSYSLIQLNLSKARDHRGFWVILN